MLALLAQYLVSPQITADELKKADLFSREGQSIRSQCSVESKLLPLLGTKIRAHPQLSMRLVLLGGQTVQKGQTELVLSEALFSHGKKVLKWKHAPKHSGFQ